MSNTPVLQPLLKTLCIYDNNIDRISYEYFESKRRRSSGVRLFQDAEVLLPQDAIERSEKQIQRYCPDRWWLYLHLDHLSTPLQSLPSAGVLEIAYGFDLWILLHFTDIDQKFISRKEMLSQIRDYSRSGYPNNIVLGSLLQSIVSSGSESDAIDRAERLFQKAIASHPNEPWNAGFSSTNIHRVIANIRGDWAPYP